MSFGDIDSQKLRAKVKALDLYLQKIMNRQIGYSFKQFIDHRNDISRLFKQYIRRRRDEIKDIAKEYDLSKKEIGEVFKFEENNIISTFDRNIIRAFGQAAHSIEKSIGEELNIQGRFGVRALLSIIGKKPKAKDLNRVEGISRLTSNNRIFKIDLIPYLLLLIRTEQANWERRLARVVSYQVKSDLVRISPNPAWLGPNADEVCNRWRDRIVSLNGFTPGFPKMQEALDEKPPLFHPNCRHSFLPLTPSESRIAINKKIKFYKTLKKHL